MNLVQFNVSRDSLESSSIKHSQRLESTLPKMSRDPVLSIPFFCARFLQDFVKETKA